MMIVVSYVPLLYGTAEGPVSRPNGTRLDPKSVLGMAVASMPSGAAQGCTWVLDNGLIAPVLVMENAVRIREHLDWWSEGKPHEWFDLQIAEAKGSFSIAAMPRLKKSVEREAMRAARRGLQVSGTVSEYHVVHRPLHYVSATNRVSYDQVRKLIRQTSSFGLVDPKELDSGFPDVRSVQWIEGLRVVTGKDAEYASLLLRKPRS